MRDERILALDEAAKLPSTDLEDDASLLRYSPPTASDSGSIACTCVTTNAPPGRSLASWHTA